MHDVTPSPPNLANTTGAPAARQPDWLPSPTLTVPTDVAMIAGVESALLYSVLGQMAIARTPQEQHGFHWYTVTEAELKQFAPFWQARDIQRLGTQLRELNLVVIASAPFEHAKILKYALKPLAVPAPLQQQLTTPQAANGTGSGAGQKVIAPHWQPDRDTLMQLAQHTIPENFALEQVGEFITYWRERNEPARSWEAKFFNHVLHKWRDYQTKQSNKPQTTLMHKGWRPSEDAVDVLTRHAQINRDFVEDAIAEFVLYWREQGAACDNWNRRFRDHVTRQWAKYNAALEHDPTPRRLPDGWQPSRDVYDVLRLANIDLQFATELVPEFAIYWRDSNQVHSSWNTRFLQYVKRRWAQRSQEANQQSATRDLSLESLVTDRSWAD